jgi:hypothetical protein
MMGVLSDPAIDDAASRDYPRHVRIPTRRLLWAVVPEPLSAAIPMKGLAIIAELSGLCGGAKRLVEGVLARASVA